MTDIETTQSEQATETTTSPSLTQAVSLDEIRAQALAQLKETDTTNPPDARSATPADEPAAKEEVKAELPAPEQPKDEQDSKALRAFAALSKKEARLAAKEKELKAFHQETKQQLEKLQTYDELFALAKQDPHTFLDKLGVSADEYIKSTLNAGTKEQPDTAKEALKKAEQLEQQLAKQREEQEQERWQAQAKAEYQKQMGAIQTVLNAEPDEFKITRAVGGETKVWEIVAGHIQQNLAFYQKNGIKDEPHLIKQAAQIVEQYFQEQVTEQLSKLQSLKKLSEASTAVEPKISQKPKTLNNSLTNTSVQAKSDSYSLDDLRAEALRQLREASKQ